MDTRGESWYVRAFLYLRFALLPYNVWPLVGLVALAFGLWVACG